MRVMKVRPSVRVQLQERPVHVPAPFKIELRYGATHFTKEMIERELPIVRERLSNPGISDTHRSFLKGELSAYTRAFPQGRVEGGMTHTEMVSALKDTATRFEQIRELAKADHRVAIIAANLDGQRAAYSMMTGQYVVVTRGSKPLLLVDSGVSPRR
jgi:hypothetical protein